MGAKIYVINTLQDFISTLDEAMVRKLAIRSLRGGIGSMDYIITLLIMEDGLDENPEDGDLGEFGESSMTGEDNNDPPEQLIQGAHTGVLK